MMMQTRSLPHSLFWLLLAGLLAVAPLARAENMIPRPPEVEARSYLLLDAKSGQVLVEHNADKKLPPASLTKMMTAYLVEKEIQAGNINFDRAIATPDMMGLVGRLGKVLGPRGLMPNPRVGTVTPDVTAAVKASKGGAVEFRVEKAGIVQAGIGKASFSEEKLVQNIKALADAVAKAKPAGSKGTYIQRVAVSSTMGPGVKVEPGSLNS